MDTLEERVWSMGDYVDESPRVARENLARADELTEPLVACCGGRTPTRIRLVASGSSFNACQCALPFMASCLPGVQIDVVTPHRFTYYEPEVREGELVAVVTQSGLSTNALEALDVIRAQGARAVCLTGNVGADARDHADVMVDWGAGTELVGYVTKGVTTLALFLMMFAARLGGRPERMADLAAAVEVLDAVRASTYEFYRAHEKALTSMRLSYSIAADGARGVALEGRSKSARRCTSRAPPTRWRSSSMGPTCRSRPRIPCSSSMRRMPLVSAAA